MLFASFTISRQNVWSSRILLWEDSSKKTYYDAFPYTNYGLALEEVGKYEEAKKQYLIALKPEINDSPRGRAITANNLSILYIETKEYPKAEYWLNKALTFDPYYGKTYYHLGLIYYIKATTTGNKKYYSTAEENLRNSIKIYNGYGKANLLLAKIYSELGLKDKALEEAKKARDSRLSENLLKEAEEIIKINNSSTYK